MSEELHISEILLKRFDETHKDITEIKVGQGRLMAMMEAAIEKQIEHTDKISKIDERLHTIEGEWRVGRLLVMLVGIISTTWVGLFVKDIYQSIKHA